MIFRFLVLFLLSASGAYSQIRVATADEEKPDEYAQRVRAALRARIGSASRYTLSDYLTAELVVNTVCIGFSSRSGGVCGYDVRYYPRGLFGLSLESQELRVAIKNDPVSMAEEIFDDFVENTSEDKLKSLRKTLEDAATGIKEAYKKKSPE